MREYEQNQYMPWWDWIKSLWDWFEKAENKILGIKSDFLAALIGTPTIPIMIITFGILSLLMLIPHTWSWLNLSLIEWSDRVTERMSHSDIGVVRNIFLTIVIISPFLITAAPYGLYRYIKGDTTSKSTQEECTRLEEERVALRAEMDRHRELMMDFLNNMEEPKDFKPKKSVMVHTLDKGSREQTLVSPGVYIREGDYSIITGEIL